MRNLYDENEITELLKVWAKNMGLEGHLLEDYTGSKYALDVMGQKMSVGLIFKLDINPLKALSAKEQIIDQLHEIDQKIVKSDINSELIKKLQTLEKTVNEQKAEIEKLRKYETHFEMQMVLNHGRVENVVKAK